MIISSVPVLGDLLNVCSYFTASGQRSFSPGDRIKSVNRTFHSTRVWDLPVLSQHPYWWVLSTEAFPVLLEKCRRESWRTQFLVGLVWFEARAMAALCSELSLWYTITPNPNPGRFHSRLLHANQTSQRSLGRVSLGTKYIYVQSVWLPKKTLEKISVMI